MTALFTVTILLLALIYAGLGALIVYYRRGGAGIPPLAVTLLLQVMGWGALALLPSSGIIGSAGGAVMALTLFAFGLAQYGIVVLRDLQQPIQPRLWWVGHGAWALGLALVAVVSPSAVLGVPAWTQTFSPDLSVIVGVLGWVIAGGALLFHLLRAYYRASLPEIANRAMYWVLCATLYLSALALIASGSELLVMIGGVALLAAMIGTYNTLTHHSVFDVRVGVRQAASGAGVTLIGGAFLMAAFYATSALPISNPVERVVALLGLALGLAFVFLPVRQVVDAIIVQVIRQRDVDPAQVTREYSKQVSQAVDLRDIVSAATTTLNSIMGISQSGILLVSNTAALDGNVELAIVGGSANDQLAAHTLRIPLDSPVYHRLAVAQLPVSQFELAFSARFGGMTVDERAYFNACGMHAYAPIIMDNVMVGILLCGGKVDDSIYEPRDLTMLATMAQQIGFALRNARLVADLRHLNTSMRSLNRGLEEANQELAKLDSVKSDFVTIASHELRTPLAQIRGYTDMIDSINEAGLLEQAQVTGMVSNLRKASERMEELIGAMLDVSQLDVNALDLRFAPTTPEAVLRMAIEPLTNEIKQRKLNLTARWKGLPSIQADLQRLVQAFRNIVVNAIKFTPDGGHIEIIATLKPAAKEGEVDHIMVRISDTGVGIDKENLDLIFKKFFRTYDPSLHSTGTYKFLGAGPGLGLTIAKGVIEAHGGRIWAESQRHSLQDLPGTSMYVLLPIHQTEDAKRALKFDDGEGE